MQKIMFNSKLGLEQAVLEGRKTMTRRIISSKVWGKYREYEKGYNETQQHLIGGLMDCDEYLISLATFKVGEIVAVAQRYCNVLHCADVPKGEEKGWGNKMFVKAELMPHHIKITDIKVERLQDISGDDCLKEGIREGSNVGGSMSLTDYAQHGYTFGSVFDTENKLYETPREAFAALIDKVSGKGTWDSNPWVFVYDFKLID